MNGSMVVERALYRYSCGGGCQRESSTEVFRIERYHGKSPKAQIRVLFAQADVRLISHRVRFLRSTANTSTFHERSGEGSKHLGS